MIPILAQAAAASILCADPGVIDGDTLRCDGFKLRLWGIDAPEHDTPDGPAATRALGELVNRKTLVCQRKGHSYDRIVARCWIDHVDVSESMVRGGYALDWPRFSHGAYARWSRGERQ